ncbi:MAG: hypothetical protein ACRD3T_05105, partial [Terriglobia bacterium]
SVKLDLNESSFYARVLNIYTCSSGWGEAPLAFRLIKRLKMLSKFVAGAAKFGQPLFFGALKSGGILNAPMDALSLGRKDGAALPGVVTHRDDVIELLSHELVHGFGTMTGDINPYFTHHNNSFGANLGRLSTGAENVVEISTVVAKEAFGHLAACRVSSAQDQYTHLPKHLSDLSHPCLATKSEIGPSISSRTRRKTFKRSAGEPSPWAGSSRLQSRYQMAPGRTGHHISGAYPDEGTENLRDDIAGNLSPGNATQGGIRQGDCGIEMSAGNGAEGQNQGHRDSASCQGIGQERDCGSAARRSPMMPEPTTAVSKKAVATASATSLRRMFMG